MDKLWAPWRSKYIYSRKRKGCIFCSRKTPRKRDRHYVIARTKRSFAMLNIYPYNNGHVMVAPFRHVGSLDGLSTQELLDLISLVKKITKKIDKKLRPEGYNIGMNIGRTAGAGFAGHVHIHIVPRWNGDTNFMPVLGNVKVVSESLEAVYGLLKE